MSNIFTLARESSGEPFAFEVDGETLTLAHMGDVDQYALAELYAADDGDLAYMVGLFDLAAGDDAARLRALKLPRASLVSLHSAYMEHCGSSAGESPASSD